MKLLPTGSEPTATADHDHAGIDHSVTESASACVLGCRKFWATHAGAPSVAEDQQEQLPQAGQDDQRGDDSRHVDGQGGEQGV